MIKRTRKLLLLWALLMAIPSLTHAQVILKRQVLGSTGSTYSDGNIRVAATVAQPSTVGTTSGGALVLRQGFQQPSNINQDVDPCGLNPSFTVEVSDNGVCGTSYAFTYTGEVQSGLSFVWNFGENSVPATSTEQDPTYVTYNTIGFKQVSVTVTFGGCTASSSTVINVLQTGYNGAITASDVLCFGDDDAFASVAVFGGTPPFEYLWSNGESTAEINNLSVGIYSVTVQDANGCSFVANKPILGPTDSLKITAEITHEECENTNDGSIILTASGGTTPYTFVWNGVEGTASLENIGKDIYGLLLTDANGCILIDTFAILEFCTEGNDSIPTVFTPNGDGINDGWIIPGIDNYPNNQVYIYSRWGEPIYVRQPYSNSNPWTGNNSKGEPLQAAAYFYVVKLNDDFNTIFSGSITLLR